MQHNPWTTHLRRVAYENAWIAVEHHEVTNPSGNAGIYGVVRFKNWAVGVVPIDDEGHTYLVGQYRYPLDLYSWEIPEGGCPKGEETTLQTAQRELLEETGLQATHWEELLRIHTSNSVTDEYGVCYLARGLSRHQAQPEDTELLQVRRLPLAEAVAMALRGEITDSLSLAALLKIAALGNMRGNL